MASLHQRNRIVVFRLTQEEYENLRAACIAAGGRNISDFTRNELLSVVQTAQKPALERRFIELDRKLDGLHDLIRQVSDRIPARELVAANHD